MGVVTKWERGGTSAHQPAKVAPVVQLIGCDKNTAVTALEREEEIEGKKEKEESRSGSQPRAADCRPIRFVCRCLGGNGTQGGGGEGGFGCAGG